MKQASRNSDWYPLKFIYFEKATKFCETSIVDLTVTTQEKSTMKISQNFVAFSEYLYEQPVKGLIKAFK